MRTTQFRRQGTTFGTVVLAALFVLLLMIQLPSAALASTSRVGIDVDIHGGGNGEISVAGVDVNVRDADTEEFSAVGVEVNFEGHSAGDVSIAAVEANVEGEIGGDLSVAAADVYVNATVDGELALTGAEVYFEGSARTADIAGAEVTINGTIDGDLRVAADTFRFEPGSVVTGDFYFEGPHEPTFGDEVSIAGSFTYEYRDFDAWVDGDMPVVLFPMVALAGITGAFVIFIMLAFAVLVGGGFLLLLMTGLTARTIDGIREKPLSSMGMGIVVLLGLMGIALLLCVTVIGIPLAMAILAFYPILMLIGFTVAVLGVPYLLLRRDPRDTGAFLKVLLFFASIFLFLVLFSIPFIGHVILSAVLLMGIGAFGAAVLGGRNSGGGAATTA